jgi:hypothetical protein
MKGPFPSLDVGVSGKEEGMEGSRPRRERWEGVRGMSVIWSFGLRFGKRSGKRGRRAQAKLMRRQRRTVFIV